MQKNLYTIEQQKKDKKLCKILSVILVVLMFLSSAIMCVSAATTSWGLQKSQVSLSYFYNVGNGGSPNYSWSVIRQRCFLNCKTLANRYNDYVVNTNINFNLVNQLEYCYNNGYHNEAVDIGNRWNTIYVHIVDAINDTSQLVGYGTAVPTINGQEVTVEQYQNLYDEITAQYSELNSIASEIRSLYEFAKTESNDSLEIMLAQSGNIINFLWGTLKGIIIDFGTGKATANSFLGISISSISIQQTANAVSAVTKTFAYAIAVILFGVNISATALQNEILTLRGGIRVFARVLMVKFWIDLSIPICIYILNMINSLATQILNSLTISNGTVLNNFNINSSNSSSSFFDGIYVYIRSIINSLNNFVMGLPTLIIVIVMAVCMIIAMVKMVARGFELNCLVSLAPIFFATLVGEETKRYFSRFISAFLSTAGYIVYVTIIYAVGTKWVVQCASPNITTITDLLNNIKTLLPRTIIIIACCRVMVKPPKALLSLVDGG